MLKLKTTPKKFEAKLDLERAPWGMALTGSDELDRAPKAKLNLQQLIWK